MKDSLGDRMKKYENVFRNYLPPKSHVIIRIDGKAFHTFTRNLNKPFDNNLIYAMMATAREISKEMQGFKLGYIQSDEASFYLTDTDRLESQGWFDYNINKIVSISASLFTAYFNNQFHQNELALFDARAFILPKEDVPNYFVWRYKDWVRNSLNMYARSFFSHKELMNKSQEDIHQMLYSIDKKWATLPPVLKNGTIIFRKTTNHPQVNYDYINNLINMEET